MNSVVIIDDDRDLCRTLEVRLEEKDYEVNTAHTTSEGLDLLRRTNPDFVLVDLKLPDGNGLDILEEVKKENLSSYVVMMTGYQDMEATIQAMKKGAFDYLRKPFDIEDIVLLFEKAGRVESETSRRLHKADGGNPPREIVGKSEQINEIIKEIGLLSRSDVSVLIEGETGTGKELVARALHRAGSPDEPFVAINCSAVVPNLFESELFGHKKGAFTGADSEKKGKLEYAGEGSVFLDEISDMPLELQSKLLRVLQERKFQRVGGLESISFKARIIAATNKNLEKLIDEGKFREDLYYRLAVSKLNIPPLRERREDIEPLVDHLLDRIGEDLHFDITGVEEKALKRLKSYEWRGNVRELENVLTRAAALTKDGAVKSEDLEFRLNRSEPPDPSDIKTLSEAEKEHIEKALIANDWNITRTSEILEISPTTLRKKIRDYELKEA